MRSILIWGVMKKSLCNADKRGVLYEGPLLLSGDFNIWSDGRAEVVETSVAGMGLMPLEYEVDYRNRWFGQKLDHIEEFRRE